MAGRPRKPTNLLLFSGSAAKHPDRMRARANEPVPAGPLGEPPEYLSVDEADAWQQIVTSAAPGQLTIADSICVEVAAKLYARVRAGDDHAKLLSELRLYLTQLGLSPASRSHVSVAPQKSTGPGEKVSFADL